jgi:hypothetical protein
VEVAGSNPAAPTRKTLQRADSTTKPNGLVRVQLFPEDLMRGFVAQAFSGSVIEAGTGPVRFLRLYLFELAVFWEDLPL